MNLILVTTVMIDVLCGRNARREFRAEHVRANRTLATTVLNVAELFSRMRWSERSRTESLLGGLLCYELSPSSARSGGSLKFNWAQKGHTFTLVDALIAAIAIENHCQLLTDNRKHFPMPELNLHPLP